MPSIRIDKSASALGRTVSYTRTVTSDGGVLVEPSLAAAKTGTLSTRSSNTAGTLTMSSGHGITDGQKIDIYWDGGVRTNATVGTVATNSVPITSGGNDNLPTQGTAVTVMVVHGEDCGFTYTGLVGLMVDAAGPSACVARFVDSGGSDVGLITVETAGRAYVWCDDAGSSPLSGSPVTVYVTHGDSSAARVVTVTALFD